MTTIHATLDTLGCDGKQEDSTGQDKRVRSKDGVHEIIHPAPKPAGAAVGLPWPSVASVPIVTAPLPTPASESASSPDWPRKP